MYVQDILRQMPKVELHVHLEGATRPEAFLELAARNNVSLPVRTPEEMRRWYTFKDFPHFIEIYYAITECICSAADVEFIAREFLKDQAAQNIRYTEVIFTPYVRAIRKGVSFPDQVAALRRASEWARQTLGTELGLVPDISRETTPEAGLQVAEWAVAAMGDGVIGLGLGGPEVGNPPEKFTAAFDLAYRAGLPALPHAGETEGPASIWGALESLHAVRILHGVRCFEDPRLVDCLRDRQIPLDVTPISNICLGVFPDLRHHPLPRMLAEGLFVTLSSDDPPMFSTSLTQEYLAAYEHMGLTLAQLQQLDLNGIRASLLLPARKAELLGEFESEFRRLEASL